MAVAMLTMGQTAVAAEGDVLARLRQEHPRVLLTRERLAEIRKEAGEKRSARADIAKAVVGRAEKILGDKKNRVSYTLTGPRLLTESRRNLDNVMTLAMAHLLTGEKKYEELAVSEMLAAGEFKDWNPSHFLDTAEMTAALAIGYDWLYESMTADERAKIRKAIVTLGLEKGAMAYKGEGAGAKFGWWTRATHNWSQVCNGGLAMGALAIAGDGTKEETELARFVVESGLVAVRPAYGHWDKDGGWDEGPGYWGYTMQYTAFHMAALETATGSMQGLEKTPGLGNAGAFRMHFVGPSGKTFNFADAGEGWGSGEQMFFLARVFDRPEYAAARRAERVGTVPDLIWYDGRGESPEKMKLEPSGVFRGVNVAFLRTDWSAEALWVGVKGGDNGANHSHLDLGTFVFDAMGKRWAMDLGSDEYNMPGYFGKERFTYYRLKTEGHNTLVVNGENQPAKAKAAIVGFDAGRREAVIDLSQAYPRMTKALRGIRVGDLNGTAYVLVQDELEGKEEFAVTSALHTAAKVDVDGNGRMALLTLGESKMRLQLLTPGRMTSEEVKLEEPQHPAKGVTRITIVPMEAKNKQVRMAYRMVPLTIQDLPGKVVPLAEWRVMGK